MSGHPHSPILTVNLHAVIDETFIVEDFHADGTFRSSAAYLFPAGKGVSVALALAALRERVETVAIIGENEIPLYERLAAQSGFILHVIPAPLETRRHVTISDPFNQSTTHIQVQGYEHPAELFTQTIEAIERINSAHGFLVLSGSLPPGAPVTIYAELIALAKRMNGRAVLDSSGEAYRLAVESKPFAIKPNKQEAEVLLDRPLTTLKDQVAAVCELRQRGIEWVVLSDGPKGVLLACEQGIWHGRVPPERVRAMDNQGCGDSLVAGLVHGWKTGWTPEDVLRCAVACAAANVEVLGAGRLRRDDVERFMPLAEIQLMNE